MTQLVRVEAEMPLHEHAHPVVAQTGPPGVGADVLGSGTPGGDRAPVGKEQRAARSDRPVGVAVGQSEKAG